MYPETRTTTTKNTQKFLKALLQRNSCSHRPCPTQALCFLQTFYFAIVDFCDNGGKRPAPGSSASFTKEQADTIRRIRSSKDSWDMLGLKPGASR